MEALNRILETFAQMLGGAGLWALPLAFVSGVVTSLLPCTLSALPLIIGYVGGIGADSKRGFRMSVLFSVGMALTVTALGVVAVLLGRLLLLGGTWFYLVLGALMILMALQLFGVFEFIPSTYLTEKAKRRGYLGALLAGVLGGLFASPCATPVLVVLLGLVATQGSMVWGILLLLVYALGHSVLVITVGSSVGLARQIATSPRYRRISSALQFVMGVFALALGLYLLYLGF